METQTDLKTGSLVQGALDLVRAHPIPLLLPLVVLGVLTSGGGGRGMGGEDFTPEFTPEMIPFFALFGLFALVIIALLFLVTVLAWLVTVRTALDALATGRAPDVGAAFKAVQGDYWRSLGVLVLWALAVAGGFILLIAPGVFLMAAWFPIVAVLVAEGPKGTDSLGRAWALTQGNRGALVLLILLAFVGHIAASLIGFVPLIGDPLAGAASGVVNAVTAAAIAIYYQRRTPGEPRHGAIAPRPTGP